MHSTTLIKLSRQGDASAIATIMGRALQPHGIGVKVKVKADRVKILLEAHQVPDRQRFVPLIARGIEPIQLSDHKIYVYGRQRGSATIAWVAGINPHDSPADPGSLRVAAPGMAASTASLGLSATPHSVSNLTPSRITEEHLIHRLSQEISQRLVVQQVSGLSAVSDIEIEGHDVLVTFETREKLDSRALAALVRQAVLTVKTDTLKIARLYKRHPRTQRSLPIREILLGEADTPAASRDSLRPEAFDSLESVGPLSPAEIAHPPKPSPLKRPLRLGLLGLGGIGASLGLAGWISPLLVILIFGMVLILWQVFSHLLRG